jgi:hypothetical protein
MSEDVMKIKDNIDEEDIVPLYVNNDGFLSLASQMQENVIAINNCIVEPVVKMQESIKGFATGLQNTVKIADNMGAAVADVVQPLHTFATEYKASAVLLSDLVQSTKENLVSFQNVVTDFPLQSTSVYVDPLTSIDVDIESATVVDTLPASGISLASVARQRTSVGILEFETEQSLVLKVDSLEAKVDTIQDFLSDEIYPFLVEDSKRKDDLLNDILAYYKGKPKTFVKVSEVGFSERACKLTIDGNEIPVSPNTNEEQVCKVIFKNKTALEKQWSYDEIVEAMGEGITRTRSWNRKLYQVARQLNDKIAIHAGLKDFIVYTTKTVNINPTFFERK